MEENKKRYIDESEALVRMEKEFQVRPDREEGCRSYLEANKGLGWEALQARLGRKCREAEQAAQGRFAAVTDLKTAYLRKYPNRTFSASDRDNTPYDKLLTELSCDDLERFKSQAEEQARSAAEHFKDDFIFKIRSAIREAMQRRDELNG